MSAEHLTPGQAAVRLIAILEAEGAVFTLDADEEVTCSAAPTAHTRGTLRGHQP